MSTTNKSEITGAPRINDTAPDFTAETTQGTIHFHDWIGNGWGFCFRIRKTSLPSARQRWGAWLDCSPSPPTATARLST